MINYFYNKIKIIYTETLPFEEPKNFNMDKEAFQYICV